MLVKGIVEGTHVKEYPKKDGEGTFTRRTVFLEGLPVQFPPRLMMPEQGAVVLVEIASERNGDYRNFWARAWEPSRLGA